MKEFRLFALALVMFGVSVLSITPAYALQCKGGNYGSDECWTEVQIASTETTPVIAGTVLEFSSAQSTANDNAFIVTVANASADHSRIAGVAQGAIATGDRGRVLVRGKGKIRKAAGVAASGDYLYASSTGGAVGIVGATGAKVTAFALESAANAAATIDGYIVIV